MTFFRFAIESHHQNKNKPTRTIVVLVGSGSGLIGHWLRRGNILRLISNGTIAFVSAQALSFTKANRTIPVRAGSGSLAQAHHAGSRVNTNGWHRHSGTGTLLGPEAGPETRRIFCVVSGPPRGSGLSIFSREVKTTIGLRRSTLWPLSIFREWLARNRHGHRLTTRSTGQLSPYLFYRSAWGHDCDLQSWPSL